MFKLETIKSKNLLEEKTLGFLTTEFDLLIIDFESNKVHRSSHAKYEIFLYQHFHPTIETPWHWKWNLKATCLITYISLENNFKIKTYMRQCLGRSLPAGKAWPCAAGTWGGWPPAGTWACRSSHQPLLHAYRESLGILGFAEYKGKPFG